MKTNKYYVYSLVDPRTSEIFYIGKGKGKRKESHLKKNKMDFNLDKVNKIKSIIEENHEVIIEIIFDGLDEDIAFELEKNLIYKLGRKRFCEGQLLNLIPGGKWKPGNPVLHYAESIKKIEHITSDIGIIEKYNSIKKVSTFDYLAKANVPNCTKIYRFESDGTKQANLDIEKLFNGKVHGHELELLGFLRNNELPIMARLIFSKYDKEALYLDRDIPYSEFDTIDEDLNKKFSQLKMQDSDFEIESKSNGVLRGRVERIKQIVTYSSFYPNGSKKARRSNLRGKLVNESFCWNENGTLTTHEEFFDGYSDYIRTTFYENGHKHIRTSRNKKENKYERWFDDGTREI